MRIVKHIDGLYSIKSQIDLIEMRKTSLEMEHIIKEFFAKNSLSAYSSQSTMTTELFSRYNLLLFPFPIIHDLYREISIAFHALYEECHGTKAIEKHFIQCWLNVYRKGEFIDWHDHQPIPHKAWHGFICVDTQPNSYTSYAWPNDRERWGTTIDIPSEDGNIVMGLCNGDLHRSSKWENDEKPRITIAFDIVPANTLSTFCVKDYKEPKYLNAMRRTEYFVNHWIPI